MQLTDQPCHTIKVAAKLTGLTTHVIRVWEKRYGAVVPNRSGTRRRLFSDADLERLTLLRKVTERGHSISTVANLQNKALGDLVKRMDAVTNHQPHVRVHSAGVPGQASATTEELLANVRQLDEAGLEHALAQALVALGAHGFLLKVVSPLAQQIGDLWAKGTLTAAHEHFASAILRDFLRQTGRSFALEADAPGLVVATPAGQLHELGAAMAATAAASAGWRVAYLGANLPAAEIAGAAATHQARVVALSIVYPSDDPNLAAELTSLRKLLPAEVKILAGGRAIANYRAALRKCGAENVNNLDDLFKTLTELRNAARA